MVNINDFKRELSKLAGVDFFNPRFRDVFNRYFGEEQDANAEVDRAEELGIINSEEAQELKEDADVANDVQEELATDTVDDNIDNAIDDKVEENVADEKIEEKAEEVAQDVAEDVADDVAQDEAQDSKTTESETESETKTKDNSETVEVENETEDNVDSSTNEELLDAKIELGLVRAGVREDKIKPAMVLAKAEIKSMDDLGKIKDIVKQFPEWMAKGQSMAKGFGMPVDDDGDGLSEEEKRFKQLYGVDPRD